MNVCGCACVRARETMCSSVLDLLGPISSWCANVILGVRSQRSKVRGQAGTVVSPACIVSVDPAALVIILYYSKSCDILWQYSLTIFMYLLVY